MDQRDQHKTLVLTTGHTYAYKFTPASNDHSTFLLLHGFPSTSIVWDDVAERLSSAGYGVLRPDLLGCGDTSKPLDVENYSFWKMSSELAEILDSERLASVIGVGHDWGAVLLARMWWCYRHRFSGFAFMSVPYGPPTNIDLEAMNAMSKKVFGYEMGGYWYFLISEEAPSMLDRNVESAMSLFYSSSPGMWKDHLLPSGSLRDWVAQERVCEPPRYVSRSDFDMKKHRLLNDAFKLGGFQAPLNWYKSAIHRIDAKHEDALPIEQLVITLPVSVIAGQDDPLGRPDIALDAVEKGKQYLPDAKVETIKDASHWMMMEKPDETTLALIALANRAMHRGSRTQN